MADLLMRHAGQPSPADFARILAVAEPAALPAPAADPVTAAFAAWRGERDLEARLTEVAKALLAKPDAIDLLIRQGDLQIQLRRWEAALATYRRCLELAPERDELRHLIQALGGGGSAGSRAPDAYLQNLFDAFAGQFDQVLVHWLGYRGPELVHAAVLRAIGARRGLAVLDLGCGTGLNGPLFRPLARRLDGVDLSAGMLNRARDRKLYDSLEQDEICRHMAATGSRYDLVLASDVLIYFGDLAEPFAGAARVLRPGGIFAGTVELLEGEGYRLHKTARYAHGEGYLRACAQAAGFTILEIGRQTLRTESKEPVVALVLVMQRDQAAGAA